jgi:hypothetical protein
MRIKTTSLPVAALNEGDRIEMGVSHELKINGDGTWVNYKVTTKVGDGETAEAAHQRALEFLSQQVEELVKRTVEDVLRMSQ